MLEMLNSINVREYGKKSLQSSRVDEDHVILNDYKITAERFCQNIEESVLFMRSIFIQRLCLFSSIFDIFYFLRLYYSYSA